MNKKWKKVEIDDDSDSGRRCTRFNVHENEAAIVDRTTNQRQRQLNDSLAMFNL